ncbi:hypothetical protein [Oscillibacter sp.]|uniref:hypothetical protein n=1 Tax=Oscillibacter sp. TaxID=1945593 RepID=UPI00289D50E5|nr:hypothetical protein [Oscillibacter sp.]
MIHRKNQLLFTTALLTLSLLTGCGDSGEPSSPGGSSVGSASSGAEAAASSSSETKPDAQTAEFSFSDISELEFWFGSGAGAWRTVLYVADDGSFEGLYTDSDMGSADTDYPNGTCYSSEFTGTFTTPEKVDEYTYSVEIQDLTLSKEPGTEEIRDGIKYLYSEPYGLDDAKELLFYLSGAPVKDLPEGYLSWARGYGDTIEETLPFYGLYNVGGDQGFSSHPRS